MKTRSGRILSASALAEALAQHAAEYVAGEEVVRGSADSRRVRVKQHLSHLVQSAVSTELARERDNEDDAEGLPLSFSNHSSPLSTAPPSRAPSPWPETVDHADSSLLSSSPTSRSASPEPSDAPNTTALPTSRRDLKKRSGSSSLETAESKRPRRCSTPIPQPEAPSTSTLKGRAARRKRKNYQKSLQREPGDYKIRASLSEKHRRVDGVQTSFDINSLQAAKGAHIGLRKRIIRVSPALAEYLNKGFKLLQWDG